jgi:hypothetical protein
MITIHVRLDALPDEHARDRRSQLIQRLIDRFGFKVLDWGETRAADSRLEILVAGEAPSHAAIQQMVTLSAEWIRQGLIPGAHLQVGRAAEMSVSDIPAPLPSTEVPNTRAEHV